MVVFGFGVLGDPAHRVDAGEKRRELHRAAEHTVGVLPPVEIGQGGGHLFIGQYSHKTDGIPFPDMTNQVVVAGAVIARCATGPVVLIAQRRRPPELAGRWELPGGKVVPGESEATALARELAEELGLDGEAVRVGERLGADVALGETTTLRAYLVGLRYGRPRAHDHQALRWVTAAELADVDWVPADRAWLAELTSILASR